MNDTVFTKSIDELGRIVLPKEIRKKLDMDIKSSVDLHVEGSKIIITKTDKECVFCKSTKNLTTFKDQEICQKCISQLK